MWERLKIITWTDFWVLVLPATMLTIPGGGEVAFTMLAFTALRYVVKNRRNPFSVEETRTLSWLVAGYYLVSLLSVLASGDFISGFEKLGTSVHFFCAPFLAVYLLERWNSKENLLVAIKVGVAFAFVAIVAQWYLGDARPSGALNELVFGALVVLLSYYSLIRLPVESNRQKALSLLVFVAGMLALLLSQSRGPWIAVPVLFMIMMYAWKKTEMITSRQVAVLAGAFVVLCAFLISRDPFQRRFSKAIEEVSAYADERNDSPSSIGHRFAMWQGGIKAFLEKPVLGHGVQNTQIAAARYVSDIRAVSYSHLHNEYLTTMVGRGLLGLAALLSLLLIPVAVFLRCLKDSDSFEYSVMGLMLCIGYGVFGLTNLAFGQGVMNSFFVFFLALLMPRIKPYEVS